jgi:hypothetical protein
MTTNNKASIALILGTFGGLVTMTLHPTGHDISVGGRAALNVFVHSLALLSQPLLLMGMLVFTLRFTKERATAVAAYIIFAWASVAIMLATTMSGFVATSLLEPSSSQHGASQEIIRSLTHYTGLLNSSFATVFAALSSVAIIVWSAAMLREAIFSRGLAVYGLVVSSLILIATLTGNLRMNIHGFGALVLGQGIWFMWIAGQLRSQDSRRDGDPNVIT